MDELFKLIREECSSNVWSRGVELARSGAVVGEKMTTTEAILRVATPGRAAAATVKLWPAEDDWLCDCQSGQGPCEHVAAAIIAIRRAKEQGKELVVSAVSRGIVVYRLSRKDGTLVLSRFLRVDGKEVPLQSSLSNLLSGRVAGPPVNATKEDMTADSLIGRGPLPDILMALRECEQLYLDGKKISVGPPTPGVRAVVTDQGDGVRISIEPDPQVEERFANGVLLKGGSLLPVREPELSPLEKEIFARGRTFAAYELAQAASVIVPKLRAKIPVDIRTSRLPKESEDSRPRLIFRTWSQGDVLSAVPLIVYGDPPYARIDGVPPPGTGVGQGGGKLVLLEGGTAIPVRNERLEERLAATLHSELGLGVGKRVDFRGEAAEKFAAHLRRWNANVTGDGIKRFAERPPLEPAISVEDGKLRVSFKLPGGGSADSARVFEAWRGGMTRVALLSGDGWAPIPREWLEKYGDRVALLLESKTPDGKVPVYARPEVAHLCEEMETPCPPEFSRLRDALDRFTGIPRAKLPDDLTATLRPYQQRGVDWLAFLRANGLGALLADDMGLGKTLQALSVFSGSVLVVAPTSVLPNWQRELARFRPGLRVSVYHGPNRRLHPRADVTLTTYAILRMDASHLAHEEWDMVVLDEAQNIKNPESLVTQAAYQLRAGFRVALTGTPVENRLEDLWSLFHFLNPGLLGGRSAFRDTYSTSIAPDLAKVGALRSRIKPFVLRRLKQEVAPELPPRTEVVLYCELEKPERVVYDAVHAATRNEVVEKLKSGGSVLQALEALLRLRQAACHPALIPGQAADDSSKVRLLTEKLDEVVSEGHKALVFSQWTSLIDLIEPKLKAIDFGFARIDGATPASARAEIVDRFQSESGPPVLLMTLKAGGVGLNLTAADYVFLVDPWWNPAAEDQAADRAHRIGQDRPVFVNRLVARDTVEEKILGLQEAKRAAAAAALGGAGHAVAITRDELMELLR